MAGQFVRLFGELALTWPAMNEGSWAEAEVLKSLPRHNNHDSWRNGWLRGLLAIFSSLTTVAVAPKATIEAIMLRQPFNYPSLGRLRLSGPAYSRFLLETCVTILPPRKHKSSFSLRSMTSFAVNMDLSKVVALHYCFPAR